MLLLQNAYPTQHFKKLGWCCHWVELSSFLLPFHFTYELCVLPLAIKLSCSEDVAQTHHPIRAEVNWGFFFNAKTLSQQQEESELPTSLQIEFTWRICCWLSKELGNTKMDMLASTEVSVRSLCTCDCIAATCLPAWILLLSRLTSCNPCYTHAPNSYLLVTRLSPCNIKISLRGAMIP